MTGRVVAVTAGPALDRVVVAPAAAAAGTVRVTAAFDTPGGKALHAAIVAGTLGAQAEVIAPLGGPLGDQVRRLLHVEPVVLHEIEAHAASRETLTVVDPEMGDVLEVLWPVPPLTSAEEGLLLEVTRARARAAAVVVVAGSAPPQSPDLPTRLVEAARSGGAFVILDSSAPALARAVAAGADMIAPNVSEAAAVLGLPEPSDRTYAELARLARALRSQGAPAVWLTAGEHGSVLASADGEVHLSSVGTHRRVNAVGCGDALIGGLAAGLASGASLIEAACLGVAAATDKLGRVHPARVDPDAVRALQPGIARRGLSG